MAEFIINNNVNLIMTGQSIRHPMKGASLIVAVH